MFVVRQIKMSLYSPATSNSENLTLRTHPDLNRLQEDAFRQRDAYVGALIRRGLSRLVRSLRNLVVPPVTPHGA